MTYSALAIANEFFDLAQHDGKALTPMKMQKLVYLAHGYNLAFIGEPLLVDRVEAWKFGPVIPKLYHALKDYGTGQITKSLTELEWFDDEMGRVTPMVDGDDDWTHALIQRVWEQYKRFTAAQLSNMTHRPGTPWSKTVEQNGGKLRRNQDIDDKVIEEHFEGLLVGDRAVG